MSRYRGYLARPARVGRTRRHGTTYALPLPPGLHREDVEVCEHWLRGGGRPEVHSVSVAALDDQCGGWWLRAEVKEGERDAVVRRLLQALAILETAPEEHHEALKRLCWDHQVEQAVELARALNQGAEE